MPQRDAGPRAPAERVAQALGWFSLSLGLAALIAPGAVSRAIGLGRGGRGNGIVGLGRGRPNGHLTMLRLFGAREIAGGLGIISQRRPAGWLWGRALGDLLDLGFLGAAMRRPGARPERVLAAMVPVVGVTALDVLTAARLSGRRSVSRGVLPDGSIRVVKSIAVNRPVGECYAFWRDVSNLPRIMHNLQSVEMIDERRSRWTARGPGGSTVQWEAEITEDVPNELIAWRSVKGADVDNEGSVRFQPTRKDNGTLVRVVLRYRPPAGALGAAVAQIAGRDPERQIREDLRRFKRVLETGEIITVQGQPKGPPGWSVTRRLTGT